ncbi:hypothetical protein CCP2SC5_1080005 [Azospirillaceae bacterium]
MSAVAGPPSFLFRNKVTNEKIGMATGDQEKTVFGDWAVLGLTPSKGDMLAVYF